MNTTIRTIYLLSLLIFTELMVTGASPTLKSMGCAVDNLFPVTWGGTVVYNNRGRSLFSNFLSAMGLWRFGTDEGDGLWAG